MTCFSNAGWPQLRQSLKGVAPHLINRKGLSRSFQITSIFPRMTVFENIRCGLLWAHEYKYSTWKLLGRQTALNEASEALLERLGLQRRRDLLAGLLTYAEQRALEVGVTIAGGAEVIDIKVPTYNAWNDPEFSVLLYEFKDGLNTYLKKSGSPHASLEALITWNKANAAKAMPFFGQEIFEQAQAKGPLTDPAYKKARGEARRLAGRDGLLAVLAKEKLDAVIAPSLSPAWPTDHVLGDHFVGAGYGMSAVAGTPSLTVPIGDSHGLPLGVTFMGPAYSEGELIGFGYALEQATKARRPPTYKATLDP